MSTAPSDATGHLHQWASSSARCLLALVITLALFPAAQAERERVVCPAIDFDDFPPILNANPEPRPVLIALGTAKELGKDGPSRTKCRLEIEEVLYGDRRIKTVEFSSAYVPGLRGIYSLRPGDPGELEYVCSHFQTEVDNLPAIRALCAARFNCLVLGAESIVVGEEAQTGPEKWEIKVIEQMSGPKIPLNETIPVSFDRPGKRPSAEPGARPERNIYLLEHAAPLRPDAPVTFGCQATLALESKPEVIAALARRNSYPLLDDERGKTREVVFDGTADEAMELFNSGYLPIQLLGQRFLVHHADEARTRLTPLIEGMWLETGPKERAKYYDQKARIETLALAERLSPTGAIVKLAEKLVGRLEALPPQTANAARAQDAQPNRSRWREENDTDSNHSLTWLLQQIDEKEVARRWASRLTALKDRLTGSWREEVALAISVMRIDSNPELGAALARMQGVPAVRSAAALRHPGNLMLSSVAFSPDGKLVATGDSTEEVRVWDTRDWHAVTVIPRGANRLVFSPDSKSLYLGSSGKPEDTALFSRYDARTGAVDRKFENPTQWIDRMQLSRDGRTMLTASYMDGSLIVWDTATGVQRRSELLPRVSAAATLSEDGRLLARQITLGAKESEILIEPVEGKEPLAHIQQPSNLQRLAFTPDGVHLLSVGESLAGLRLQVHTVGETADLIAEATLGGRFVYAMVASSDGKFVAVSDQSAHLWLYSVPDLKPVWSTTFPEHRAAQTIAFSQDGKWLIAATNEPAPRMFRMDNFEEVPPPTGHHGFNISAYFSSDSRRLWSVDVNGTICHWDAATMKMIERHPAPEKTSLLSIREPDGKYAVFIDGPHPSIFDKGSGKMMVVDLESGKTVSRLDIPRVQLGRIYWLPDGQFLMSGSGMEKFTTFADYLNGKVLQQFRNRPPVYRAFLSADHRSLIYDWDYKSPGKPTHRLDLVTGKETKPRIDGEGHTLTADGETYTLLGGSGVPERWPEIRGVVVQSGILSPNGRRLAVVTGEPIQDESVVRTPNSEAPTIVRIHDAKTLRMICAIASATRRIEVRFNADGTQLAIAHDDGTIERWPLPE